MSGKGISRKAQDSGTAGSGSSESKRRNCSKIDAEGATINSGCGSGNKDLMEVREHITTMKGPSKRCKGTDGFNNIRIPLAGKAHNFGAFSGDDTKRHGTSSNPEGSNVSGTRDSFNATGKGTGRTPTKRPKQDSSNIHPTGSGSENSFNERKIHREATIHRDGNRAVPGGGTRGSFNVTGEGSKIGARGATNNSGCCAGSDDAEEVGELIAGDPLEECSGTELSFNAKLGGQININGAGLNTGAFSGGTT